MSDGSRFVPPGADAQEAELAPWWLQLREHGCALARERLFERYTGYARSLAVQVYRQRGGASELDDLVQWAYVGLLEAIDRFDSTRGIGFATFANARVRGSISDGMRRNSELQEQLSLNARLRRERLQSLRAGVAGECALQAIRDVATGLALGRLLEGTGLYVDGEHTPCPRPTGYEALVWEQRRRSVVQAVTALPDRLQAVIRLHYYHLLPFAQIARVLGVSAARASQLHQSALRLLREQVRAKTHPRSE